MEILDLKSFEGLGKFLYLQKVLTAFEKNENLLTFKKYLKVKQEEFLIEINKFK